MLGTWEIILIVLVILLIFGGKKIPELMKGIGKGMRSFRDGVEGKTDKEDAEVKEEKDDKK
ncbi:MAG: twin-arginine translocase TatA/TatE family subunit [Paludibacteraceae bacterium]|nr:twin-arginine translocase TatA/TatE family subunit [Paludibacteraceae bacterium]